MPLPTNPPKESWIATTGTVTSCKFQFAGLSTLIIGFNTRQKFRIMFDYYAHGRLYSDVFGSPTAIPQNTEIPITYNPFDPAQNSRTNRPSESAQTNRPPILLIGIAGSILLSLAWLAILRGCN
jgi:hypothetical protein